MPKLSQHTLEKRFLCTNCGQTFRTRQGLSGHIQFKHPSGALPKKPTTEEALLVGLHWMESIALAGFSEEEKSEIGSILVFGERIKVLIENEHITFNNTDFRSYMVISLAQMHANEQMLDKLQQINNKLISEMTEIEAKILASVSKKN